MKSFLHSNEKSEKISDIFCGDPFYGIFKCDRGEGRRTPARSGPPLRNIRVRGPFRQ